MRFIVIATLLASAASWQTLAAEEKAPSESEKKATQQIEKAGGAVRTIAQNDDRKEVSFQLAGAAITDENLAPLRDLTNVVQLNLGKTSITDAGLANVKGLTKLTELHLELTKITDKGLANLKDLQELTHLNLYGTAVTDAGLAQLAGLTKLRHLYVWQTKATQAGVDKLKKSLPNLDVELGSDTPAKKQP